MKIGIFGGSFNPIHNGHINLCKELLDNNYLDVIYLMPNATPPHKNNVQTSFMHRLNMIKLAIKNIENLKILDCEKDSTIKHYTYNTLENLKTIFKDDELFFIMGADSYNDLLKWYKGMDLLTLTNILVFKRPNYSIDTKKYNDKLNKDSKYKFYFIENKLFDISSTTIRSLLLKQNKEVLLKYINNKVYKYIIENQLFC